MQRDCLIKLARPFHCQSFACLLYHWYVCFGNLLKKEMEKEKEI